MRYENLSNQFTVRKLNKEDIDSIYSLSCGNEIFYRYHPPFVTKESILEDMEALPEGKSYTDKFYLGFFDGCQLVAVMDLIVNYPETGTAFIGLFKMASQYQGKGLGSSIISECVSCLQKEGFRSIQLGTDKDNPQSNRFWEKIGFLQIKERNGYLIRELKL